MRDEKGKFLKGFTHSKNTQFKKGQHWRAKKPFWEKEWLQKEYIDKKRSCGDIARQFGVTAEAVLFWLKKHKIKSRNTSDARAVKYWGSIGSDNPMWNKIGELNPMWKGGITAERQAFYASPEWKKVCSHVWSRDNATCQRCEAHKTFYPDMPFHIHHLKSFKDASLRAEPLNLILVCEACHHWIHSKKNKDNDYIQ